MTRTGSPVRTRISARRSSRPENPADRPLVDPLQIQRTQVLDPDPERVQDPPVRLPLAAPRPKMAEFMEQETEDEPLARMIDQGERADRSWVVEGVHQAALPDPPPVHLPEEDDLSASDGQLCPGERRLGQ